jgi:hypothetical protein
MKHRHVDVLESFSYYYILSCIRRLVDSGSNRPELWLNSIFEKSDFEIDNKLLSTLNLSDLSAI